MIVFGSEYRTAHGHLDPQASARRLIDGGPVALALAPAGFVERSEAGLATIAAIGEDGDPAAQETAEGARGPLRRRPWRFARAASADLMIVGSKPGGVTGRISSARRRST